MKNNKSALIIGLIFSVVFSTPFANAAWDFNVEGGAVIRDDGNATKLRLRLFNNDRPLNQSIYADWYRTENGDNSYEIGYLPRYWLGTAFYVFGEASLRVDKPLAIDQETQAVVGVGNQFLATDTQALWGEIGVGQRNIEFSNDVSNDEAFALARGGYRQSLTDLLRIELDADIIQSDTLTESSAEAGIVLHTDGGAIKVSYRTRRLKADGQETLTDSESFISFNYGI